MQYMEEAIHEADTRVAAAANALAAQKGDIDQKMLEKNDELEIITLAACRLSMIQWHVFVILNICKSCCRRTCWKATQRKIEGLAVSIADVESSLKGELTSARLDLLKFLIKKF